MSKTQQKIAIITGASHPQDIGTAICRRLAGDGVNIFFTHWHADLNWIGEFKQEILSMGVSCEEMSIDYRNPNPQKRYSKRLAKN